MTHDFDNDFAFSTGSDADALVRRACHRLDPRLLRRHPRPRLRKTGAGSTTGSPRHTVASAWT